MKIHAEVSLTESLADGIPVVDEDAEATHEKSVARDSLLGLEREVEVGLCFAFELYCRMALHERPLHAASIVIAEGGRASVLLRQHRTALVVRPHGLQSQSRVVENP